MIIKKLTNLVFLTLNTSFMLKNIAFKMVKNEMHKPLFSQTARISVSPNIQFKAFVQNNLLRNFYKVYGDASAALIMTGQSLDVNVCVRK